ncbi:50S ribosomal protein L36 [Paenibacillus lactis]
MDFQCFTAKQFEFKRVMSRGCRFIYMNQNDVSRKNGGSV